MTYEQIWNLPGEQMDRVREKYGEEFSMEKYEQLILETVFTLNYPDPEECQLDIIDNADFQAWRKVAPLVGIEPEEEIDTEAIKQIQYKRIENIHIPGKESPEKARDTQFSLPNLSNMSPQEVLGSLKDQTRGIWSDDPRATEKMQSFLEKDIYTHSRFRESAKKAQKEMEMRLDSRGDIVKHTILGDRTDFNTVKSRRAKSDL